MSVAGLRVLLCDDHAIVREGVRALLEEQAGCEVVGEAADGEEAIRLTLELRPDVVVMDISMSGLGGIQATERIRRECPSTRVLILSMLEDAPVVRNALRAGADGYVVKGAGIGRLIEAIEATARGDVFLSPEVSRAVVDGMREGASADTAADPLSEREREVLKLIAEGVPTAEIARRLHISPKTVGNHRTNIMQKLDVHDVTALTRYAVRTRLVVP